MGCFFRCIDPGADLRDCGRYPRWSGMRRPVTKPDRQPARRLVVVDPSAVAAILFGEPSAIALLAQLAAYPERLTSAANYVETGTVLAGRRRGDCAEAVRDLDAFLDAAGIVLGSIDAAQAKVALAARICSAEATSTIRLHMRWRSCARHRCCIQATTSAGPTSSRPEGVRPHVAAIEAWIRRRNSRARA